MTFVILFSLLIGLSLGLLGGGGSILTVPLLVYGLGVEAKAAIATSLLVVGTTSTVATIPYARRAKVCWRVGAIFGTAGMLGAFGGGSLARFIPASALLLIFAAVMVATAVAMLRGRPHTLAASPACPSAQELPMLRILLDGLMVGGVTGLVGAGGGFLVVPALTLLGGLSMHAAIGTSLLVIAMKSSAGLMGYISHVSIDYALAAVVTLAAVMGSLAGSWLSHRVPAGRLRKGFGWFVIAVAFYLLYRELTPELIQTFFVRHRGFWLGGLAVAASVLLPRFAARVFFRNGSCQIIRRRL